MKVFGIGFQKTGTSALAAGLYILGFNVTGFFGTHDPHLQATVYDIAFELADRYDGAQDTPWPILYKELDARYPNSKFILTVRDSDKWIKSVVNHFKSDRIPAHEWMYGVPMAKGYEEAYIRRFEAHNQEVIAYFKDRPNDLLVMDITKGDGWEKLCPFLGKDVPLVSFPKQNTASDKTRQVFQRGVMFIIKKFLPHHLLTDIGLEEGANSSLIRDMLHYHYAMYHEIWKGLEGVDDRQFVQEFPFVKSSICDLLLEQMNLEQTWLHRIDGNTPVLATLTEAERPFTKNEIKKLWESNENLIRNYIANMNSVDFNCDLTEGNGYIWEAFFEIMNDGSEHRAKILVLLEQFNITVKEKGFVEFFHGQQR